MSAVELSMPHLIRPPRMAGRKPPMLLLLHGAGGSEKEFFNHADLFDERFAVITVRAPFMQGHKRYLWFGMEKGGDTEEMDSIQVEFSRRSLAKFVAQAVDAYQLNPAQVYVLGFGQGAVMALSIMLTDPDLLAGAVVISGQIPEALRSLMARPEQLKGFPVLVMHGLHDELYPIGCGRAINIALSGYPVLLDYREKPVGHLLSQEALDDASAWLTVRLDASGVNGALTAPEFCASLGHVQIKVRNLERAVRFYVRFIGLRVTERTGNAYAFLSSCDSHHDLALQNIGPGGVLPGGEAIGLHCVGFEAPNAATFALVYKNLISASIPLVATDHIVRWSLYFKDPDGNGVEVYLDTRKMPGRSDLWLGRDLPLQPETILAVLSEK